MYDFRDYVTPAGVNHVERWLKKQPEEVREEFTSQFATLAVIPRHLWSTDHCAPLKGKYKGMGLYEFKVRGSGKRNFFRIGAFFVADTAILFAGWSHAAGDEKRGYAATLSRKKIFEKGQAGTVQHA